MAKYKFRAITPEGATVSGIEDALTANMARRALIGRDLAPLEVIEKKSILKYEITREKVPRKELMYFSRQMAVFMKAGIPVLEALEIMTEETSNKVLQRVMAEMADSLRSGETFAGAASQHPEAFPRYYLGILGSAELTGNLDTVLDQLSEYIDRDLEARRRVSSALMYPSIVFVIRHLGGGRHHRLRPAALQDLLRIVERQAATAHADASQRRQFHRERLVLPRRCRRCHCVDRHPRRGHIQRVAPCGTGSSYACPSSGT